MSKIKICLNEIEKAKNFVNKMTTFMSDVDIVAKHYVCDAKSLLGVLSFDLSKPVEVEIISDDEEEIKRFNEVLEEFK